jgi:hypothetical protein
MGFTEKQTKQIEKCIRNKIYISDEDIMVCIKSKPKKKSVKVPSKFFFGLF